jgi:hypothetical protein
MIEATNANNMMISMAGFYDAERSWERCKRDCLFPAEKGSFRWQALPLAFLSGMIFPVFSRV